MNAMTEAFFEGHISHLKSRIKRREVAKLILIPGYEVLVLSECRDWRAKKRLHQKRLRRMLSQVREWASK